MLQVPTPPTPPARRDRPRRRKHYPHIGLSDWHHDELRARSRRGRSMGDVIAQLLEEAADGKRVAVGARIRGRLNEIRMAAKLLRSYNRNPELIQWFSAIEVAVGAVAAEFPA